MARDTIAPTQPATPSAPSLVDASLPALEALGAGSFLEHGEVIGRGGMGEVRVTRDTRLGRQLALKTSTTDDADATRRFVREARVQGQLEHPGVVPVHELGLDADGRPFFTMKRVRGITLAEVLRDPSFPRRRLLTFLQTLSRTLDFAHSRGVVHRDVKPANVMLGDFGEVYLLDWGLAKLSASDEPAVQREGESQPGGTIAGAVMGTPGYMAPEQAAGKPATGASDVWALGALLYEALTGERLIDGRSFAEMLVATQQLTHPSPRAKREDVSPELDALCLAALHAQPGQRPTAREFADRLEAVLAGERDSELRATLAERHARSAEAAADLALQSGSLDARREALREVGQALALDPGLSRAHAVFGRLLAVAPPELPREVRDDLADFQRDAERTGIRNGFIANLFTGLLLALVVFLVNDWQRYGLMAALWAVATGASGWLTWKQKSTPLSRGVGLLAFSAFTASLSFFAGPFVVVPTVATAYAMSLAIWLPKRERAVGIVLQLAAVFVPWLLSVGGALPPFYEARDGGIFIRTVMVPVTSDAWAWAMALSIVGTLLSATLAMVRVRGELNAMRQAMSLQRWNLEQLRADAPR